MNKTAFLGGTYLAPLAQKRRVWAAKSKRPPSPSTSSQPHPAVASRHLYVLFYICMWMWGQVNLFLFLKRNSSLGTISTGILITLNYYYTIIYYLLHLYTLVFFFFMLKLCCVALPIGCLFSVFTTVWKWKDKTRGTDNVFFVLFFFSFTHIGARYTVKRISRSGIAHSANVTKCWWIEFTICLTLNTGAWTSVGSAGSSCTGQWASEEESHGRAFSSSVNHLQYYSRISILSLPNCTV